MWGQGGQGWGMGIVCGITGVDLAVPKATILPIRVGSAGHEGGQPIDVVMLAGGVGAPGCGLAALPTWLGLR